MKKEQGIDKDEIGREKFLEHAWEWKEEYGGKIINQLKKLGASADWERERFTMDEGCSKAVQEVFIRYMKKAISTKVPVSSTGVRYARLPFPMQRLSMRIRTDFSGTSITRSSEKKEDSWKSQQHVRRLCLAILQLQ